MSQAIPRRSMVVGSVLAIVIIVLVVITALIHLDKAIAMGLFASHTGNARVGAGSFNRNAPGAPGVRHGPGVNPPAGAPKGGAPRGGGRPSGVMLLLFQNLALLFFLNFVGYIVLGVALYLPPLKKLQRVIRWLLIAFTALTVAAYFAIAGLRPNPMGYADKAIEVVLIILLIVEDLRAVRLKRLFTSSIS